MQILPTNKSIFPESKMVIELVLVDIQKSVKNNPWVLKDIIGFAKFNQALSWNVLALGLARHVKLSQM